MFTKEEIELLEQFVSDATGNVFVVYPQKVGGMIGAIYARYSRAKGGFRETLLKEFIQDGQLDPIRADNLIARILIMFGDDSVQELESAWLSLEGISNVATKAVEDLRLGAYIEQSTRYVEYDELEYSEPDGQGRYRYLREPTIMASGHARRFEEVMDTAFTTYAGLIEPMKEYFRRRKPLELAEYEIREGRGKIRYADCRDEAERKDFERTYNMDIRAKTCDTLRIILPVATKTNVGMHANGRTMEHMLQRLYSSDLPELQELARKAHDELNKVIPRYVQRAERSEYLASTRHQMQALADKLLQGISVEPAPAVEVSRGGFSRVGQLAAMLYPYSRHSFGQLARVVGGLSEEEQHRIFQTYIGKRRHRRDRAGRALEFGYPWEVDLQVDVGIYRDLHRHRMVTQERQPFTTRLGFSEIPEEIVEAGYVDKVKRVVDEVPPLYEAIRADLGQEIAQYVVLLGSKTRFRMGLNDREAQHLLELRTGPQGHRSYRRVCQMIYREMEKLDPWVAEAFGFVDQNDYDWPRADSEARQRAKEAKLKG